jgi:hypothetical protein
LIAVLTSFSLFLSRRESRKANSSMFAFLAEEPIQAGATGGKKEEGENAEAAIGGRS